MKNPTIKNTLKNLIKTRVFTLFALILLFPFQPTLAEEYESTRDQFKFSYDPSFVVVDVKFPNVAIALRNKAGSFPTFNIVIDSVPLNASKKDLKTQEKELLDSYALAGMMNTKMHSSSIKDVNGKEAFIAEVEYSLNNIPMVANVAIINSNGRNFILTFIDSAMSATGSKPLFEAILSSFSLLNSQMDTGNQGSSDYTVLGLVLGILLLGGALLVYKKFFKQ